MGKALLGFFLRAWALVIWCVRMLAWIPAVVEIATVGVVGAWIAIGAVHYAIETHWSMRGLLTLIDKNWKGCLILTGVVFYRTILSVVSRVRKVGSVELAASEAGELVEAKPLRKRKQPADPGS